MQKAENEKMEQEGDDAENKADRVELGLESWRGTGTVLMTSHPISHLV